VTFVGSAATGGLVFAALQSGPTVLGLVVPALLLVAVWRGLGWSQFYSASVRTDAIEFKAMFRKVTCPTADVVDVSWGRKRSWWRARSGSRFFFFTMEGGRTVHMMAAKGTHDFVTAVIETLGLAASSEDWSSRYERGVGRSGFVRMH